MTVARRFIAESGAQGAGVPEGSPNAAPRSIYIVCREHGDRPRTIWGTPLISEPTLDPLAGFGLVKVITHVQKH
jgi:hypothetical protein